jgi:hypothetical protein
LAYFVLQVSCILPSTARLEGTFFSSAQQDKKDQASQSGETVDRRLVLRRLWSLSRATLTQGAKEGVGNEVQSILEAISLSKKLLKAVWDPRRAFCGFFPQKLWKKVV